MRRRAESEDQLRARLTRRLLNEERHRGSRFKKYEVLTKEAKKAMIDAKNESAWGWFRDNHRSGRRYAAERAPYGIRFLKPYTLIRTDKVSPEDYYKNVRTKSQRRILEIETPKGVHIQDLDPVKPDEDLDFFGVETTFLQDIIEGERMIGAYWEDSDEASSSYSADDYDQEEGGISQNKKSDHADESFLHMLKRKQYFLPERRKAVSHREGYDYDHDDAVYHDKHKGAYCGSEGYGSDSSYGSQGSQDLTERLELEEKAKDKASKIQEYIKITLALPSLSPLPKKMVSDHLRDVQVITTILSKELVSMDYEGKSPGQEGNFFKTLILKDRAASLMYRVYPFYKEKLGPILDGSLHKTRLERLESENKVLSYIDESLKECRADVSEIRGKLTGIQTLKKSKEALRLKADSLSLNMKAAGTRIEGLGLEDLNQRATVLEESLSRVDRLEQIGGGAPLWKLAGGLFLTGLFGLMYSL